MQVLRRKQATVRASFALALTGALASTAGLAQTAPTYLSEMENAVFAEQNLARTNPQQYADFIEQYWGSSATQYFEGNLFVRDGRNLRTQEGWDAVKGALDFLRQQPPIAALTPSKGMSMGAKDHVKDTGRDGHTGSDGSKSWDRIDRYGQWSKSVGENLDFGSDTAREVVMSLIIDDGVASRGHRANIFNQKHDFKVTGVGCGPDAEFKTMCAIVYAGSYTENTPQTTGTAQRGWYQRPELAKDIGVGADGSVWKIGTEGAPLGGYPIHKWNQASNSWDLTSGAAVRIAVAPNGIPWVVNDSGATFYANDTQASSWTQVSGVATDIGVGADGSVWKIGTEAAHGGHPIYKWNQAGNSWDLTSGAAVRIAVAPNGIPWVVNDSGAIFHANDAQASSWTQVPGAATDIGVGADGSVWVTGTKRLDGGHEIRKWTGSDWNTIAGAAVDIAVTPSGWPWVVNASGATYEYTLAQVANL